MNNSSWIMSKMYICKSKFHFCYHISDMKIQGEETLLTLLPKLPKIIIEIKNDITFCFHTSLWCPRKVSSFWSCKKECENMWFFPLISLGQQGLGLHFVKLPAYAIFISSVLEIHINNTDTFKVTNKQYYKIIVF